MSIKLRISYYIGFMKGVSVTHITTPICEPVPVMYNPS